jgi:AraC-like DNA-binding protein
MAQTSLNIRNNNPGNIRDGATPWNGKIGAQSGFVTFDSPEMGVRAFAKNLYTYQNRGLNSIQDVVSTWAPPEDNNNTSAYIRNVSQALNLDPNAPLNLNQNPARTAELIRAMTLVEGGQSSVDYFSSHINTGIALANGQIDPSSIPTVDPTTLPPNPAVGSIDNAQASAQNAQAGGEPGSGLQGGSTQMYVENVLNKYDSYSYKWKITMVHPDTIGDGKADDKQGVILAESGVEAEIVIESVQHTSTLAFVRKNRDAVGHTWIFSLIEPMGVTFYNRIILAAERLGILNPTDAAYVLEVSFIGHLPSGAIDINAAGQPWKWVAKIDNSTLDHRDGASNYQVKFFEASTDGHLKVPLHLDQPITISGVETFGEFLQAYETEINEQEAKNVELGTGRLFPTEYKFSTINGASEWESWRFGAVDEDINSQRVSVTNDDKLTFTINRGANILAAVAMALYQTDNFQRLPLYEGGFAKDEPTDTVARAEKIAELMGWMSVDTDVTYGPLDPLLRKYQKKIHYRIDKIIGLNLVHDPKSYLDIADGAGLSRQRLQRIFQKGLLRKRFDYTFTGLNTEVINFDLRFEDLHYQILALRAGHLARAEQLSAGSGDPQQNVVNRLEATYQDIVNQITSAKTRLAEISNIIARGDNPGEREQISAGFASEIAQTREQIRQDEARKITAQDAYREEYVRQYGTQRRNVLPINNDTRYITQSDVYNKGQTNRALESRYSFEELHIESDATEGPDKNRQTASGSMLLGAVELNLNAVTDLQGISLNVRGDPYWIGANRGNAGAGANYNLGNTCFFLNIKFPKYPDDNTGIMPTSAEYDFSIMGVYRVNHVTHTYRDGQYTIMLRANRDTMVNVGVNLAQLKSGMVNLGNTRQTASRFQNADGDGFNPGNTPQQPSGASRGEFAGGGGNGIVTMANGGTIRSQNISDRMRSILENAGTNAGVDVRVTSGGQPATGVTGVDRTGSHRHDNGRAADVQLISNGRTLNVNNPADLPIIQNFINETKLAGATGFGAGNGYMGDNTFHIDHAYSTPMYWGGLLDNGTYRSRNAPRWLRDIVIG